jgi:alpha-1,3-fucosyltransferase
MLEEKYGFYAAFENSHCRDYVTEKFYNNLGHFYIPLVYSK